MRNQPLTRIAVLSLAGVILIFTSCQKKYIGPDISYGTLFNHLIKMVESSDNGVATHTYTYNASGQLVTHNIILKGKNPTRTENTVEQYFRNGAGTPDSIRITITVDGKVTGIERRSFYYSGTQVVSSVVLHNSMDAAAMRDSSVYTYNGNFLIERKDYTTSGTITASTEAYRDLVFQYSGSNISNLVFTNTVTGSSTKKTTIISYGYDTAKAALPLNGYQYGYDSVCFAWHDYTAINNLSSIKYGEGSGVASVSYEFSYLPNGRPFKATRRETEKGDVSVEYYYD